MKKNVIGWILKYAATVGTVQYTDSHCRSTDTHTDRPVPSLLIHGFVPQSEVVDSSVFQFLGESLPHRQSSHQSNMSASSKFNVDGTFLCAWERDLYWGLAFSSKRLGKKSTSLREVYNLIIIDGQKSSDWARMGSSSVFQRHPLHSAKWLEDGDISDFE